jgi:uncharacterized protein (TIGR00730 family)
MTRKPRGGTEAPQPAPRRRRRRLPEERPKPAAEDTEAPRRIESILRSATYRPALEDPEFLHSPELRGARLEIEYLKPELTLREHGFTAAIVVFGSTRIPEPAAARRSLDELRSAPRIRGEDEKRRARRVAVAEQVLANSRYYDCARELGRLVGEADLASTRAGRPGRLVIVTGGGPGIMEAANRGAFDVGTQSIGLNIRLPREQFPNPYITPELCFSLDYFAIRKLHLLMRAKALVAFPGGFGTLDELFETLTLIQTRKMEPIPVILVGESYWRRVIDFDFLAASGTIDIEDLQLFWFGETAPEIWDSILKWYEAAGTPLFAPPAAEI